MELIKPIPVTDAILTSSSIAEDDYTAWNSATAYVAGNRCILVATHKIYEAQVNNTNKLPSSYLDDGDPDADPVVLDTWKEVSATNRWKMFDSKSRAASTATGTIAVVETPSELFNSLALLNITALDVNVTVTDPSAGVVYDYDVDMLDLSGVSDYYEWFFSPLARKNNVVLTDLPAYTGASLAVTLTDAGQPVSLGECIIGTIRDIGDTQYGTSAGIVDYSIKTFDDEGNATIEEKKYSKRMSYEVEIQTGRVDYIQKMMAELRTTPVVWIGSSIYESTLLYGFYKDFDISIDSSNLSSCNITVEELV